MTDVLTDPGYQPLPPSASDSFDQERERIHRQMLSSVSHDLKTPLASIIGSLEVYERMKDKLTPDKQAALIRVALQEAYRLDNFTTNILDMAKLENGAVKPRREPIDIGSTLRNCFLRMATRLQESTVNLEALSGPVDAVTDPVLLSRVISLVLDNAVKYGGSPPVINVEYGRENDEFGFIRISDNGCGILGSQKEIIFSKYTRFAREDQQNAGTGLGLAIGREIMCLLKGAITVDSTPDIPGSVFTMRFALN
jgi:K+-sensing histidine kinase KdpD